MNNKSPRTDAPRIGNFSLGDLLGKGASGCVYKGLNLTTGDFVAIKRVEKAKLNNKTTDSVRGEVSLLRNLDHTCILRIFDCIESEEYLYLILEYMENGSLANVIDKFGPLPEALVVGYVYQLLLGLQYLHQNGVLHRDIKAANVLIDKDGNIKVADFGVAEQLNKDATARYSVVGTPYWMAPEAIEMQPPCSASDIWAVGATIIEMLTSKPPYYEFSPISAIFRIVQDDHPPIPEKLSDNMKDLIAKCFVREVESRPTAADLMKHAVFTQTKDLKNPTYEGLQDTLRTFHRNKNKKHRAPLQEWNFATPSSSPEAAKKSPIAQAVAPPARNQEELIKNLQEELRKEKELGAQRDQHLQQLAHENAELLKKVANLTLKAPEDFYRDYFITMAMSFKLVLLAQHKEIKIDINTLLEAAQKEKVAIHELVEWIPATLKKKQKNTKPEPRSRSASIFRFFSEPASPKADSASLNHINSSHHSSSPLSNSHTPHSGNSSPLSSSSNSNASTNSNTIHVSTPTELSAIQMRASRALTLTALAVSNSDEAIHHSH